MTNLGQAGDRKPARKRRAVAGALALILSGASVMALVCPQPALAQRPDQSSLSNSSGLEEVVVTARRRSEKLQSVPIAITAFSQESLEKSHVEALSDLQHLVPSMTLYGPFGDTLFVSIRGQGGYSPGAEPGVASYMNEVPIPTAPGPSAGGAGGGFLGGTGLFYDLDNLQVLKGPQGTLFGRNTTGGSLLLQSKRPTNALGGYVQLTVGDYDDHEVNAALNLPIVDDKLLVRVAVNGAERDGYTKTLATSNHPDGLDLDNRSFFAARASITLRPSDNFQNDLIVDTLNNRNNGSSGILTYVDPNSFVNSFYPRLLTVLRQQQALGIRTQVPINTNPFSHETRFAVTDIMRFDLTDDITLRNIVGYSKSTIAFAYDGDGTMFPIFDTLTQSRPDVVHQYSDEPQIQGKSLDGSLTWVVGGFFLRSPAPNMDAGIGGALGGINAVFARAAEASQAAYAQATYDLSPLVEGLKLTGGFRYTWDSRYAQTRTLDGSGACLSPSSQVDAQCTLTGNASFRAPTWTLGLDYQLDPNTLIYVVSRRGYRSGGFNFAVSTAAQAFQPEYVTDVELGMKADWTIEDMRGRTNAALYHQDYTDIQVPVVISDPILGATQITENAAKARLIGAEFEGIIDLTADLEVGAQFTWLDFKYTQFGPGTDPAALIAGQSQNRPRYKYGLNARYTIPVDQQLGKISISANWNWQDKNGSTANTVSGDSTGTIGAYGLLSLAADWNNIAGQPIDASFFMTNATDRSYATGGFPLSALLGTSTVHYGEPRMFGFKLRYRFGADAESSSGQ